MSGSTIMLITLGVLGLGLVVNAWLIPWARLWLAEREARAWGRGWVEGYDTGYGVAQCELSQWPILPEDGDGGEMHR